ncbi:MAG: N-acetyltransferase [Vicinamibacterales bacterium]
MRLVHWRELDSRAFQDIWHTLSRRWAERLSWDNTSTWRTIETQRQAGSLPGLALVDNQRVLGWSYFGVHRETLQIGGLEAQTESLTQQLVDALLDVAEPDIAPAGVMCFAFSDAPGLEEALRTRGFTVDRYLYLSRNLAGESAAVVDPDWDRRVAVLMPGLLERAYGPPEVTRPFARQGHPDEWREYVGQVLGANACGQFEPRLSAARLSDLGDLDGAVVTTVIGPGAAHIAQVAVRPERRGHGLASAMLHDVIARASADGFASLSLLVNEHNTVARRLYESLGFQGAEHFVSAGRGVAIPHA